MDGSDHVSAGKQLTHELVFAVTRFTVLSLQAMQLLGVRSPGQYSWAEHEERLGTGQTRIRLMSDMGMDCVRLRVEIVPVDDPTQHLVVFQGELPWNQGPTH